VKSRTDWFRHYPSKRKCLRILGLLWYAKEAVPQQVLAECADWVKRKRTRPDLAERADALWQSRSCVQLVRMLQPPIAALPDW